MLKAKEREVECLTKEISEKDDQLKNYCNQIEELRRNMRAKSKRYQEMLKQLKNASKTECSRVCEGDAEDIDDKEFDKLLGVFMKKMEDQKNSVFQQFLTVESQLKTMSFEKNLILKEKNEIACQLKSIKEENDRLIKEVSEQQLQKFEKEELKKNMEQLIAEKKELMDKISGLHENIQELSNNFKETRWALTSEVAEKHDQVQELKRCVGALEEQLRQADMQTLFKDDIIKELRKELKTSRKPEHRGLYDVVNEVRSRRSLKNDCGSAATFDCGSGKFGMTSSQSSGIKCPEMGHPSGTSVSERKNPCPDDTESNSSENAKLQSQLECLKENLKIRIEQIREQEEFTRDLEEELTRTKMDLTALQEKCEKQERRCKSLVNSSISEPGINSHFSVLSCAINKIEETLQNLDKRNSCGVVACNSVIQQEIEKIRSVKNDLKSIEMKKSKNQLNECGNDFNSKKSDKKQPTGLKCHSDRETQSGGCNLVHLDDVESFREKAVTGVATLEQMKEQIDILESLITKYTEQFPCECDKNQVEACEEKLGKLHREFNEVTEQLCQLLSKFNKSVAEMSFESSPSCDGVDTNLKGENKLEGSSVIEENIKKLKTECQRLQKEVCYQENAAEKLKQLSKQLDGEIQQKRNQMTQYSKELDDRVYEIAKLRELVKEVGNRLKQLQCSQVMPYDQGVVCSTIKAANLTNLFSDLQEFWCLLDSSTETLIDVPIRLREDNQQLTEKLNCLEKCICNKEEMLRVLQDTVKLRECQIEELKSRMQTSECQSSKLAQDVEEKCRLIANLQDAVRKCQRFEVNVRSVQIQSLEFEVCELNLRLKKSEKEISERDKKLEMLHNEISNLTSKNCIFAQEMKIMDCRLKSMYKTCHLFEKMVNELQEELNNRDCENESLYEKIKDLENELDEEYKKCETRAAEDAKCIEDLTVSLKNFQNDLCCAQERYNMAISDTEFQLQKERERSEVKESELNQLVCQLRDELKEVQDRVEGNVLDETSSTRINDLECLLRQAESRQQLYEKKLSELQKILDCTILDYEEERKNILQKLCEEKRENLKNKTLITKLNENIKRKVNNERNLRDYIEQFSEDIENLKTENQELKTEIEARKKMMCALEREDGANLSDIEELICHLKIQKAELKTRCSNLKTEVDKEVKLKKLLECRVEDLNSLLESKIKEFSQMVDNYNCTSSKIQQTLTQMKEMEESLMSIESEMRLNLSSNTDMNECECFKKLVDVKTAENAKLVGQLQILKVEMESMQTESAAVQANQDSQISRLRHEAQCLENDVQVLQSQCQKLSEDNRRLQGELEQWVEKDTSAQMEFREKQRELCAKLRATTNEKNDLLNSVDELQKQLEQICLENVNKEKLNRELTEECSRLKINNDPSDNQMRYKTDKVICNLSKEIKNLHCELSNMKENYNVLNKEYQNLVEQYKCCEKKKFNLEKLYVEANEENKNLQDLRMQYEKELCELRTQNNFLKDKMNNKENQKNSEDKKKLLDTIKELTIKIKTLEKRVIPNLEQEIAEKNCCIENLKVELRDANISSQRMRTEALRVIQHTKKYLAAQRCANETLKSRLECSNKRGSIIGAENRELEEQLKAVTRMNEFLLCQLENNKEEMIETEPRSFSPMPWGCSNVERDTSSSEYLAESGFQSMQPSPTNIDFVYDYKHDSRRGSPLCNSLKRNKHGGSVEYPSCRNGLR